VNFIGFYEIPCTLLDRCQILLYSYVGHFVHHCVQFKEIKSKNHFLIASIAEAHKTSPHKFL
jgi:hypothetical protein